MKAHDMQRAGNRDDGKPRMRCTVCRVLSTMPEAERPCGFIFGAAQSKPTPPKAVRVAHVCPANRVCQHAECGAAYCHPHPSSKYCSEKCATAAWNRQHVKSGEHKRKLAARRAEMRADPAALAAHREADALRAQSRREAIAADPVALAAWRERDAGYQRAARAKVTT